MIDCCLRPGRPIPPDGALIQADASAPPTASPGAAFLLPLDPLAPDALSQARTALAKGAAGLGPFDPTAFSLSDKRFTALAALCCEANVILSLHCPPPVLEPHAPPLNAYLDLARRFPRLRLLLDECGGGLAYYEHMRAVRRVTENVFYGAWSARPFDLPRVLAGLPPEKVVWGSADEPIPVLSAEQWAVLDANARRLLKGGCA